MPSFFPAKKNTQYIFYLSLAPQAGGNTLLSNPTLAAGDAKVSIDGGALTNLATLPVVTPASSKTVKVTLSAAEMGGDNISVVFSDAAGAEWRDLVVFIQTASQQFDDLASQASVDALDDASGGGGATAADVWAHPTRTLTMTATQIQAAVSGGNLTIIRAVTFEATLTGINLPSGWDKLYFTAKRSLSYADADALVQIVLSNPGVGTDGLLVINQDVATVGQAVWGSLVVAGDSITISLADDATALLEDSGGNPYDLKALVDGASVLLTAGNVTIAGTPTATI